MIKKMTLPTIATLLSAAVYSQPQEVETMYFGGNVGASLIDSDAYPPDGRPLSVTGGVVGGINIRPYLALESDYSYLSKIQTQDKDESIHAWSNYLVTRYTISDTAGLYFKLGMSLTDEQWRPSSGVGVHYRLSPDWLLDVGYRWIDDIPDVDSDLYEFLIGARYQPLTPEPVAPVKEAPSPPSPPKPKEVLVTMNAGTLFGFDSDQVAPNDTIDAVAKEIQENDTHVSITGYTDSSGSSAYNLTLSQRRATALKQYMVQRGVPAESITTQGMGEDMPVASNSTSEGRAQNRRVEIRYQIVTLENTQEN